MVTLTYLLLAPGLQILLTQQHYQAELPEELAILIESVFRVCLLHANELHMSTDIRHNPSPCRKRL